MTLGIMFYLSHKMTTYYGIIIFPSIILLGRNHMVCYCDEDTITDITANRDTIVIDNCNNITKEMVPKMSKKDMVDIMSSETNMNDRKTGAYLFIAATIILYIISCYGNNILHTLFDSNEIDGWIKQGTDAAKIREINGIKLYPLIHNDMRMLHKDIVIEIEIIPKTINKMYGLIYCKTSIFLSSRSSLFNHRFKATIPQAKKDSTSSPISPKIIETPNTSDVVD